MKDKTLLYLLLFQLFALVLLFPYTPNGMRAFETVFGAGNLDEQKLIPPPTAPPETSPVPTPSPIPLSVFYRQIRDDLPGRYDLVSIRTEHDEFSDDLIAQLQHLSIPMILELHADGSGILGVFDSSILLTVDTDRMLISADRRPCPFFYLDGRLRVQDGNLDLIFEKQK